MANKPPTIALSPRGLTQEEALVQIQQHPDFKVGSIVASIRPQGDKWAIKLLEPKTAEFPPKPDDEEDSEEDKPEVEVELPGDEPESDDSDDEGPSDDEGSPFGKKDGEGEGEGPEPKDEKAQLVEAIGLLHAIAEKLGIDGPADDLLGPDTPPGPPGPGPEAGPPPHKAPAAPGPKGPGRPLRPGEAPPGTTPVGAPAFASVAEMATQIPSFTATADADGTTIKQAHAELVAEYGPHYKVGQIKRSGEKLHALLSVR